MSRKPEPRIVRVQAPSDVFIAFWGDGRLDAVEWSQVESIFTYTADCFIYDSIWVAFEVPGQDAILHVPEEAEGFQNLMSALSQTCPEINPAWYLEVMQPAFAENLTVLFECKVEA